MYKTEEHSDFAIFVIDELDLSTSSSFRVVLRMINDDSDVQAIFTTLTKCAKKRVPLLIANAENFRDLLQTVSDVLFLKNPSTKGKKND